MDTIERRYPLNEREGRVAQAFTGRAGGPVGAGWVLIRRSQTFLPEIEPSGLAVIHLALVQQPDDFDVVVVVDAGIRLELVQKEIGGEADRRGHQAAIGCEHGNLLGIGQHRWSVAAASDVTPAAQSILKACKTTLFPFLDMYSDLATVYATLKRDDRRAQALMPLDDVRKAILSAAEGLI